jgi:hypothetical protein
VADLAKDAGPKVAQLDANWAAAVLAGWTVNGYDGPDPAAVRWAQTDTLAGLLAMVGLAPAPPHWMAQAEVTARADYERNKALVEAGETYRSQSPSTYRRGHRGGAR